MADLTGLEGMFRCPASVTAPELCALYETLRLRLAMELADIPVTTVQLMRADRVLTWYIKAKQMELHAYGDDGGFPGIKVEQEVNAFLHTLSKAWDDTVIAARPSGQEALTKQANQFKDMYVAAITTTDGIPELVRAELMDKFVRMVAAAGLDL